MTHMIVSILMMFSLVSFVFNMAPHSARAADPPTASAPTSASAMKKQAEQELEAMRNKPKEFRTLITGVQIFLGRLGYGVGPFNGKLDEKTKQALTTYQKKTGLAVTGDINFETLKRLTEDDQVLNRIVPYLPPFESRKDEEDQWVDVQGSWMLKEGNNDDVLHTSRVTCMKEFQRCIDSTASLVNGSAPSLKVHTHVYDIKAWDDNKIVSLPYDGEACAISILRISKSPLVVTRFVTVQSSPGPCMTAKSEDRQYVLDDGPKIYQILKVQKSKAIQEILQVAQ